MQGGRAINPAIPHTQHRPAEYMDVGVVSLAGGAPAAASFDCLVAEQGCVQEQSCMVLYRLLEYCAAEEAVSPLGQDARTECLEAQNALQHYRPLQVCKCQRGSRREEHCLRVYWTVRFAGESEAQACICLSLSVWLAGCATWCSAPSRVELLTALRYYNSLSLALFIVLHSRL